MVDDRDQPCRLTPIDRSTFWKVALGRRKALVTPIEKAESKATSVMLTVWALVAGGLGLMAWETLVEPVLPAGFDGIVSIIGSFIAVAGAGTAAVFLFMNLARNRHATTLARVYVNADRCGGCGYSLEGAPIEDDGCRVCPECNAAWRVSEPE